MMKRKMTGLLSLLLAVLMLFAAIPVSAAPAVNENTLKFGEDGKFTILQISDTQDIFVPRPAMVSAIKAALDRVKPDLVVFTGDNIYSPNCPTMFLTEIAIDAIIAPVAKKGIPFTIIFGNHDNEDAISREDQLAYYQSYKNCLAFDDVKEIYGVANHNLTIRSADGTKDAYNLWMIDSGSFYKEDREVSKWDYVREDQVAWYVNKSNELKAKNGGQPLPSLVFQHIPLPEIFNVYQPAEPNAEGSREIDGKHWYMKLNPQVASGTLSWWSATSDLNAGEFDAMAAQGDVVGIVSGHDHSNSFVGTYRGIDFIQSPNIGYSPSNKKGVSGVRVITIDENTRKYETEVITNVELFGTSLKGKFMDGFMGSVFSYPVAAVIFLWKAACKGIRKIF